MKLSHKPCRITGLRVGEVTANLLALESSTLSIKFVLLGQNAQNFGALTKVTWSERTLAAFRDFIDAAEEDALEALFDDDSGQTVTEEPSHLSFPPIPVLGGPKRNDPP